MTSNALLAQSPSMVSFGQNRVQYKTFKWQFYETENFRIYFYQGGQDIGKYVVLQAEPILAELSKTLDFRFQRKLDVIVYADISDLQQSNIGLHTEDPIQNGQVKLLDNKLFIYFNGSHQHIDQQIRQGITKFFINKYVTGSGLKETFKNSVTSGLPPWYTEGMVAYNTVGWTSENENLLKDGILSGRFKNLTKLDAQEMNFVGHSIWAYVAEKYGTEAVANLMYLVKINRSVDRGFRYVTGKDLPAFLEEWYYYYLDRFKVERKTFDALESELFVDLPFKKHEKIYGIKLSPKGDRIAYMTNQEGKWKVHIYHLTDKKDVIVMKGGFRSNTLMTDLMNPLIDWEPRGEKLTIIYELRDQFFIRNYVLSEEKLDEEVPIRKFQKIYHFAYAEDSRNLIMSAMQKGQIDIFKYYIPTTNVTQITNDFYDDLQPSYAELDSLKGYLFVSNRPNNILKDSKLDTIIPNANFDIFFYPINDFNQSLIQITASPLANESFPQAYNNDLVSFLSDANGINNRYVAEIRLNRAEDKIQYIYTTKEFPDGKDTLLLAKNEVLDSAMLYGRTLNEVLDTNHIAHYEYSGNAFMHSNYNNAVAELSTSAKQNKQLELIYFNGKKRIVLSAYKTEKIALPSKTQWLKNKEKVAKLIPVISNKASQTEEDIDTTKVKKPIIYQSKFDEWENEKDNGYAQMLLAMEGKPEESSTAFNFSRTRQYFIKLKAEDINFSLDNKLLITPYQAFTPNTPVYNNTGITGFVKLGVIDLFENHRIHGGFRFSDVSIVPREFYLTYEDLTKRLDKEYTYYRNSIIRTIDKLDGVSLAREGKEILTTNYVHLKLKYSLDILNSVRFKLAYRNEKISYKATDSETLNALGSVNNWAILNLEFVHDHTIKLRPNTLQGFRANGYVEFQKEFPTKNTNVFGENLKLPSWNNGYMLTWGADVRHYQKVYKTITWANRLAYSTSVGTRKVVYYLGGSDGQLAPGFDQTNDVSTDQNYAFQSLAQQMRGFPQNTRNGNSYLVLNSELRVPLLSAFSKSNNQSKFLLSLEMVAFVDIGTAWEGFSPWSNDNLYTETRYNTPNAVDQATAIVKLNIYKDPIVFAFGPGLRADLFGYFFKLDLGWGYDTGELLKPRLHVSMTYDF